MTLCIEITHVKVSANSREGSAHQNLRVRSRNVNTEKKMAPNNWKIVARDCSSWVLSTHHIAGNFNQSRLGQYGEADLVLEKVIRLYPDAHLDHKLNPGFRVQVAVGMKDMSWGERLG